MGRELFINTDQGRRHAGTLLAGGVFTKKVKRGVHLHRALNAWGFDAGLMDELDGELTSLKVMDTESGEVWYVSGDVFRAERIEKDYGHGRQYFLALEFWEKSGDQARLF